MNSKILRVGSTLLAATAVAVMAAGCGSSAPDVAGMDDNSKALAELRSQLDEQKDAREAAEKMARDARSDAERARAEAARAAASAASGGSGSGSSSVSYAGGDGLLPPSAKVGECFARVLVPPTYETAKEQVLVKEESQRIEVSQPAYDWGTETVTTKEASTKLEVVPATYEWVEERILVKPARKKLEVVPATWENVTEKVLVEPARTYWKNGRGLIEKVDNTTGEIMCLVEEPARYETVTRRVVKTPETVREAEVPAEYTTVKRMIEKTPATTRRVEIPAETSKVKVLKQTKPGDDMRKTVPAEYRTITKRKMVSPSRLEWRAVYCETNMTRTMVTDLQRALQKAGHNPGPIDGIYGKQTMNAVTSYQKSKGMPSGGLTYPTLKSLGVGF